jgi:hypothetical protein
MTVNLVFLFGEKTICEMVEKDKDKDKEPRTAIRVVLRLRPFLPKETEQKDKRCVSVEKDEKGDPHGLFYALCSCNVFMC